MLWGPQGLIYGEYPGSKDGKWPAGHYSFEGDPENVPEAPEWLLAEMRAAKAPETFIKNRTALDLSDRTEDEVAVIITECLNVIENRGSGQREHWVKVGMAIHSVLPNELGYCRCGRIGRPKMLSSPMSGSAAIRVRPLGRVSSRGGLGLGR